MLSSERGRKQKCRQWFKRRHHQWPVSHAWLSHPFPLKPKNVSKLKPLTVQPCSYSTPGCDLVNLHKLPEWVWMDLYPKGKSLTLELSCVWGAMCGFSRWHSYLGVSTKAMDNAAWPGEYQPWLFVPQSFQEPTAALCSGHWYLFMLCLSPIGSTWIFFPPKSTLSAFDEIDFFLKKGNNHVLYSSWMIPL